MIFSSSLMGLVIIHRLVQVKIAHAFAYFIALKIVSYFLISFLYWIYEIS